MTFSCCFQSYCCDNQLFFFNLPYFLFHPSLSISINKKDLNRPTKAFSLKSSASNWSRCACSLEISTTTKHFPIALKVGSWLIAAYLTRDRVISLPPLWRNRDVHQIKPNPVLHFLLWGGEGGWKLSILGLFNLRHTQKPLNIFRFETCFHSKVNYGWYIMALICHIQN